MDMDGECDIDMEREYMSTFAHHTCQIKGRNTLAIDDSNDKLRCTECGRICTLATDMNQTQDGGDTYVQ